MAYLIDKSVLVAEIEELKTAIDVKLRSSNDSAYWKAQSLICERLKFKVNSLEVIEIGVDLGDPKGDKSAKYIIDTKTLEVKEVDLEKEIGKYLDANNIEYGFQVKLFDFAKHFFELGFKAQKGG